MTSSKIRQQFIDFFKNKEHTFVQSASVIPADDPTLLFTNAGMNQFKDVFLNKGHRDYTRAVNSQKCIRVSGKHNDLEEVGHDTYHHTFFEMLGNWSFGDYYKKEAISWAWELLTEVWKLPKERLYATVFGGDTNDNLAADSEAEKLWKECTDIDPTHILKFGKKDNFWEMGANGPCGPCSEIHIDLTDDLSAAKLVNKDTDKIIEIWNLVFIQFNRDEHNQLSTLPQKHIDTGAGFERLVAVLQNKKSNYETDVFTPLLSAIARIAAIEYSKSTEQTAFHVIADHIRMLAFSIADGGLPSNEGRGYVMRRILRRAARYGRKLNLQKPFLYKLVDDLAKNMGDAYSELKERKEHIKKIIKSEEESFNRTLDRGLEIFSRIQNDLKKKKVAVIPGTEVFKLYDTYGFPVDLTAVLADENGLSIDSAGFEDEMQQQKDRARASAKFSAQSLNTDSWIILNDQEDSKFVGYEETKKVTHISRFFQDGDNVQLRLMETPFYAESGGQIGDKGTISGAGFELTVIDTQKNGNAIIHFCKTKDKLDTKASDVTAQVAENDRTRTIKNHTATHLLQAAIQKVLGDHIHQAGSSVGPDRFRFDFTHHEKIAMEDLQKIEKIVNEEIQKDTHLEITFKKIAEAKAEGAMALFGEKYGDIVRTVRIGDFSLELCGGTHVKGTGEIGLFVIVSEEAVASGVRRIEALSGPQAIAYMQSARKNLREISMLLNSSEKEASGKVQNLLEANKILEKEIAQTKAEALGSNIDVIIKSAKEKNGVNIIIHQLKNTETQALKELADKIRGQVKNSVGLISSINDDKLAFVAFVSADLIGTYNAGDLVRKVASAAGGGGGGKPHMATAGGKDIGKLQDALKVFEQII